MQDEPSILEKQALGNLLQVLCQHSNPAWKDYITDYFEDWEPIIGSDISLVQYYRTLSNFPANAKRLIVEGVVLGWNVHHDYLILYETITTLIYLKICNTTEYFFLQQIYNFMTHFSKVCETPDRIYIHAKNSSFYTIRFLKPNELPFGDSYGLIDFQLSRLEETPRLAIVPWFRLFSNYYGYDEDAEYDDEDIEYLISDDIYPLLKNEFAKKHCPMIDSSWNFGFEVDDYKSRLIVMMYSLEYTDYNGV